jgi:hypothetical protein
VPALLKLRSQIVYDQSFYSSTFPCGVPDGYGYGFEEFLGFMLCLFRHKLAPGLGLIMLALLLFYFFGSLYTKASTDAGFSLAKNLF